MARRGVGWSCLGLTGPYVLLVDVELLLDHRHERGESEPREEGKEEAEP